MKTYRPYDCSLHEEDFHEGVCSSCEGERLALETLEETMPDEKPTLLPWEAWAQRHDITLSPGDIRTAYEDAQSDRAPLPAPDRGETPETDELAKGLYYDVRCTNSVKKCLDHARSLERRLRATSPTPPSALPGEVEAALNMEPCLHVYRRLDIELAFGVLASHLRSVPVRQEGVEEAAAFFEATPLNRIAGDFQMAAEFGRTLAQAYRALTRERKARKGGGKKA